jgi:ectoine hydroxylase-related dioxygenase (phytanoyl-CoA dioxygenase family)
MKLGELFVYPGSHSKLAEYFNKNGLDAVYSRGNESLPLNKTDELFKTPYVSCLGKAGDVFLCNYMTAHFVAPNSSENIRYALYFRVSGPGFKDPNNGMPLKHVAKSMLDPWVHWPIMKDIEI